MKTWRLATLVALMCAPLLGCGKGDGKVKVYRATGQLLLDGEAFGPTTIQMIPLEEGNRSAVGTVDESGNITFTTYQVGDGLPSGNFRVAVGVTPVPPPKPYPKTYIDFSTTPLQASVDARDDNVLRLEMVKTAGPLTSSPSSKKSKFDVNAASSSDAFKAGAQD